MEAATERDPPRLDSAFGGAPYGWQPSATSGDVALRVLVVNSSAGHYNLGAAKLADWLKAVGHEVVTCRGDPGLFSFGYDIVALSVIFSWHAPMARDIALRVRGTSEVWCGGPGMYALQHWWTKETGLKVHPGLDARFDRQRGSYRMTFAARGCPVACSFCVAWLIEGRTFSLDWDFQPAPVLCDNNLSALPVEFQEHIINRYATSLVTLKDANSGFEPKSFDEGTYRRWEPFLAKSKAPWRFAFDEEGERDEVVRMLQILKPVPPYRKRVYCLIGNEPIEACYDRLQTIIANGGEPFCQALRPRRWPRTSSDMPIASCGARHPSGNIQTGAASDLRSLSSRQGRFTLESDLLDRQLIVIYAAAAGPDSRS